MSGAFGTFTFGVSGFGVEPASPPQVAQTSIQTILRAYVYQQYADDDNIQAFNSAYNIMAQAYLDWFNDTPLPIYTDGAIYDSLLDWVAAGVYGLIRPSLPSGRIVGIGDFRPSFGRFQVTSFNVIELK